MRILVLIASNQRRGAEIKASRLAAALVDEGADVSVRSLVSGGGSGLLDVQPLGARRLGIDTLRRLRSEARTFDVVIAYGSSTLPACALGLIGTATPFVYRSIGDPEHWIRGRFRRYRTRLLLRRAARVVALWPAAAAGFHRISGLDASQITAIPNGLATDELRAPTEDERRLARDRFGVAGDARVVAVVGALAPEKRIDLAIRSVAELAGAVLLVVGDGPERDRLEALATRLLGDRARFTGAMEDVGEAYWAADMLLLVSATEGMPGVVLEAAASGLPVAATDVGAVRWMAEQGLASIDLVPADARPNEIAVQLRATLGSTSLTQPSAPEEFSWATVARKWVAVLHDVVGDIPLESSTQTPPIRVLAVMDSTAGGGAELSMAALVPVLREFGVETEVAYFHDRPGAKERFEASGTHLIQVTMDRSRLATVLRLRKVIQQRRPDVVHTMVYEADIIGRIAGLITRTPVISSIISDMYGPTYMSAVGSRWKTRLAQAADAVTCRFVTRFHAISEHLVSTMPRRLLIRRSTIDVIYRGRDMAQLPRGRVSGPVRATLGLDASAPLVLAVGRHEPPKALDTAILAMSKVLAKHPDAHLVVAGRRGTATEHLNLLAQKSAVEDRVQLLGHRRNVPDLMAAADVLVLPSRWEGLAGTLIEAMAVGCPIVCSDLPVLREVVTAGGAQSSTVFVPVGDDEALASAIVHVLERGHDGTSTEQARDVFDIRATARAHANQYRRVSAASRR